MKKLALYTAVINILISVLYSIKVNWMVDSDIEFIRVSVSALVSTIGIWCAYYYLRDYETVKAHEERAKHIAQHFAMMAQPSDEDESEQKQ